MPLCADIVDLWNGQACTQIPVVANTGKGWKYGIACVCEGDIKLIHCNRYDNDMHALPIERKEFLL